jgi:hypothetical protein
VVTKEIAILKHSSMSMQTAMLLLRMSFNARMDYLMRVLPYTQLRPLLDDFDNIIYRTFKDLIGVSELSAHAQHRVGLNVQNGGLGLVRKKPLAPIAYYASLLQAVPDIAEFHNKDIGRLQNSSFYTALLDAERECTIGMTLQLPSDLPSAEIGSDSRGSLWHIAISRLRSATTDAERMVAPNRTQHLLAQQYHKLNATLLKSSMSAEERASLLSASQPNASLWLTATPTEHNYVLNNEEMRSAIRMRLHLPPVNLEQLRTRTCACGNGDLDVDPLHFQSCNKIISRAATKRHDLVVRAIASVARDLDIPVDVERREYDDNGARVDRKRPDLRFTLPHRKKLTLVSDVAITHPASTAAALAGAAERPLHATKAHESNKQSSYRELVQREGAELLAMVLESFGAWGKQANRVLTAIVKAAPEEEREQRAIDARIRVSVALQRGNAILHRAGVQLANDDRDTELAARLVQPHRRIVAF